MQPRFSLWMRFALIGAIAFPLLAQESPEREQTDLVQRREEWFNKQRTYPHSGVPASARLNALKTMDRIMASQPPAGANPQWHLIGPQPTNTPYTTPLVSGRVTALAIHPQNPSLMYLGTATGGVWRSIDGGNTWTALTDEQPSLSIGSLAIDPANPNIVYAGTGEDNFSGDCYYGAGILKSLDGGNTWTQYPGPFVGPTNANSYFGGGARIGSLAIQPGSSQVLLAGVTFFGADGVYRSTDGGQTWTLVLGTNPATGVLFDPTNGMRAYAALSDQSGGANVGMYVSNDGGQTWSPDDGTGANVFPSVNVGRIALAMTPGATETLYAGIENSSDSDLLGIWKTTDGGQNWTQLTNAIDYCTPQCWYDNVLVVSPTNPNIVWAGGAYSTTLVRSQDGGAHWTTISQAGNFGDVHADIHFLAFSTDGKKLFIGSDGGPYLSANPGVATPTFSPLNSTLALTQFYPGISIDPTSPTLGIGGTQDNGTQIYGGSLTWTQTVCGDGGGTAIDSNAPTTYYSTCAGPNVYKSTSSGSVNSWIESDSGINLSDRITFIPPFGMDPELSQVLYFPTYRMYQSQNGAASWTPISGDLTTGTDSFAAITAVAVAPTDPNTVYAGTYDSQFQVTTNALMGSAATWTNNSAGLPPRSITAVAVDSTTATRVYVAFSGYTGFGDTLGHVFASSNGGVAWSDVSGNLPNVPVNDLAVHPGQPNTLFAATDIGVFLTTNAGFSWTALTNGLPRDPVLAIKYHAASKTLRAATHGRGIWDAALGTAGLSYAPGSINFGVRPIGSSRAAAVTLTNAGSVAIAISSIALGGADPGDFSQTNTCGTSLAVGAKCIITATFKPKAANARSGYLIISDSGLNGSQYVFLAGDGTVISVAPSGLTFGNVVVGHSLSLPLNVTNNGSTAATVGPIAITGVDAGDYTETSNCNGSIAAHGTCTITVTFTPSATGTRTASLAVNDSGGGNAQTVGLTGTGQ